MADNYKVTYYFGAGASAKNNQLPTFVVYSEHLIQCADYLFRMLDFRSTNNPFHQWVIDLINQWSDDLIWLAEKGKFHNTVDTYAKWCFLNEPSILDRIKKTLSIFFCIQQFVAKRIDPRYNQFITEMVDKDFKFPKNVKIINWNYDNQVQMACNLHKKKERFFTKASPEKYQRGIIYYYPSMMDEGRKDEYDMVHMNGMAGNYVDEFGRGHNYININGYIDSIERLIEEIGKTQNAKPFFNFAFEIEDEKFEGEDQIDIAKELVEKTDILVVVGYSFPAVNNPVDKTLMDLMIKGKLTKVYLQTGVSIDSFRRRFNLSEKTIVEKIEQRDSFHMALEYKQPKPVNELKFDWI